MKTFFSLALSIMIIFTSCTSAEKMISRGNYEGALDYAISKLRNKKHLTTENIKALERAYVVLQDRALTQIERNNAGSIASHIENTINLYERMHDRSKAISELMPLVSHDGYVAVFDLKDYRAEVTASIQKYCTYHYDEAKRYLALSDKYKNKEHAKTAYKHLDKIEKYHRNYKNIQELREEALDLGTTYIAIVFNNEINGYYGRDIADEIDEISISRLDRMWYKYYIDRDRKANKADLVAEINIEDLNLGRESESLRSYEESKDILIRIEHNQTKIDTSRKNNNNVSHITKEVYEKVRARIDEVNREKISSLHGEIRIYDNAEGKYVRNIPINVFHNFKGYAFRIVGDERALTDNSRCKVDNYLEDFPSDFWVVDHLADSFKDVVVNETKKIGH
jgi:hypothetical protein